VPFADLPTPCLLVDLDRLEANAAAMRARALRLGVRLRPHVKTHKVPEIARIQHGGVAGPITVSTLAEARAFAAVGFVDLCWALPLPAGRAAEAVALAEAVDRLVLLVDSPEAVGWIAAAARPGGRRIPVALKVDCGGRRAGVDPAGDEGPAIAARIAEDPRLEWAGLLTHAGHAYACRGPAEVEAVACQERGALLALAARLGRAGLPCPDLSLGSTPTLVHAEDLAGVTEVRPGNYVFFDAFQAAVGSCRIEDCALSVLCTVIGRHPARAALVLDAGALALSLDPGPRHVDPGCGFGAVFDTALAERCGALRIAALSQEHARVEVRGGLPPGAFPLGTRLRIVPNHACLAAACHPVHHAVRAGRVVARWVPVRGW